MGLKARQLHNEQKEHEIQLKVVYQNGESHMRDRITHQLCYDIGLYKILEQSTSQVSKKWQDAFQVLYPGTGPYWKFETDEVTSALKSLGFFDEEINLLIQWRQVQPQQLVTLALSLATGASEEKAWQIVRSPRTEELMQPVNF